MKFNRVSVFLVFTSVLVGCAGIPPELKYTGATKLVTKCPDNIDIKHAKNAGAILTSIVVDTINYDTWYFLLKEESAGTKYLMSMKPRLIGIHKDGWSSHKSKSRSYCFITQAGRYQFEKAYGSVTTTSSNGGFSETEFTGYNYYRKIEIHTGKVLYLGQFLLEDPRLKGKGYLGRLLTSLVAFFTRSVLPDNIEISSVDEMEDDVDWLEKNTKTSRDSVIKNVECK